MNGVPVLDDSGPYHHGHYVLHARKGPDGLFLGQMHRKGFRIRKEEQWGKYISFFSWGGEVRGVTLKGVHFPLTGGTISCSETIAISNEIEEEEAEVTFAEGRLLMVESKDTP